MAADRDWFARGMQSVRAIVVLVVGVLGAAVIGALLGLQPYFVVPIALAATFWVIFWFGARAGRAAFRQEEAWPAYAVLTFWALTVNVPAFISFDQTGFTREQGLFNPQSLARIALFCLATMLAFVFWISSSRDRVLRSDRSTLAGGKLLAALYLWYLVQAPVATAGLSLAIAIFRVMEWLVAFGLLGLAFRFQNATGQRTFEDRLRLIMPMLFFMLGSVLALLLVAPSQAYQESRVTGTSRLGGVFTHPNLLALVATILFAYAIAYWRGWRRMAMATLCVVVVGLTYSRGGYVAFALVLIAGLFLRIRHVAVLTFSVLSSALAALLLAQMPVAMDEAVRILQRGNETQSLTELSERTAVWEAAKTMISREPWIGEGFFSGPKLLGEEMIRARLSRNFAAVHAHNELLQAQLSGGVIATGLTMAIHLRVLYLLLFRLRLGPRAGFVAWAIAISVTVLGMLQPSLSYLLTLPGVLLGWALLTLEDLARAQPHLTARPEP